MSLLSSFDKNDGVRGGGEEEALARLLNESHLKNLLAAYDDVVDERFEIELDSLRRLDSSSFPEGENAAGQTSIENGDIDMFPLIKIVGIHKKRNEPLGITLTIEDNQLKITRVIKGGSVDKQGLLHAGDVILSVNSFEGKPINMKAKLAEAEGSIMLKIEAADVDDKETTSELFVRAHFDFTPKDYKSIPSIDAGLPFKKRDVLRILDKSESNWWQADHVAASRSGKIGLIPGQMFEERRRVSIADAGVSGDYDSSSRSGCLPFAKRKEKRRLMYTSSRNHEFDKHELVIYEEVTQVPPGQRKVVVLLGAQGVGRRSLKKRLMASHGDKFGTTVPHTSRAMKSGETNGGIYWFVSRSEMESGILNHKFIEYGEYDDEVYGTKVDSVKGVIQNGKICVLDVSPLALKYLRTAEFKPYVVFVAAPGAAKLRELRRACSPDQSGKPPTERELSKTIEESRHLERDYESYFDLKLVNDNLDDTFALLEGALEKLDKEQQWVPVSWVY
uniref:MPP2-6 n=1 Tax=Oscarella lobularis TaxID=121494 RepID=A0A2P1GIX3_OSCLO|nr:MPP2-6 [Oscarella lobularis]